MCGIFGQFKDEGIRGAEELSGRLFASLKHRGPDDRGAAFFDREGNAADPGEQPALMLGQTRLSIIDLSSAGHQPMFSADGRYCLVYNGEIYNFGDLRKELEKLGHSFRSNTDTEVLLYWLAEYGETRLCDLNGMFAFVFYDRKENTLLCVRDYFGIKPFYYSFDGGQFSFASEVPAMLELGVPRILDLQTSYSFLRWGQYDYGDRSFINNMFQLPPGHYLRIKLTNRLQYEKHIYWKPNPSFVSDYSFEEAAKRIRELFLKNVELHLIADVPIGISLSGGIDSSAIASAVRYLYPDRELHAFSYIPEDPSISEEEDVRFLARELNLILHCSGTPAEEVFSRLPEIVRAQGEPFQAVLYSQMRLFENAKEHGITVLLSGQGSDELFGGYAGYPGARLASMILTGQILQADRYYRMLCRSTVPSKRTAITHEMIQELIPACLYGLASKIRGKEKVPDWIDHSQLPPEIQLRPLDERKTLYPGKRKMIQTMMYQATCFGLPYLLRQEDRNSMHSSIESRVPFLTRELAEFAWSLPEEYLVDPETGLTKNVLRSALQGIVPNRILENRRKIGFAEPGRQILQELASSFRSIGSPSEGKTPLLSSDIPAFPTDEKWDEGILWRQIYFSKFCQTFSVRI